MSEKTLSESLEESYDKLEAVPETEQEPADEGDTEGTESTEGDEGVETEASESEGGTDGDEGDEPEVPESDTGGDGEGDGEETDEGDGGEDDGDTGRAPVSWTPEAREAWSKVPKEARAEIARREKEITDAMGQTASARRFAQEWSDLTKPYEGLMAAQGATPYTGVKRLLEIGAGLSMGNQEQRANIVTNLIKQYQVDLNTLDAMLSGDHQPDPMQQIGSLIDERLAPIQQRYSQEDQRRQQQSQQQAMQELSEFKKDKPFYDDVRMDMADIMEIAAKRGEQLSLGDAYERACAMNPKVSKVVQQRKAAEEAKRRKKEAESKRAASSSVRTSSATGGSAPGEAGSLTEALAAAWDKNTATRQGRV